MQHFPDWFLEQLEPFLQYRELSALARCCRYHLYLVYRRIAKVLRWGKKSSEAYFGDILFADDAFLQMQFSKVIVSIDRNPPKLLTPKSAKVELTKVTSKIPFPITFAQYLTNICFATVEEVLDRIKHREFRSLYELRAMRVLRQEPFAKAALCARLNNYDGYRRHRPNGPFVQSCLYEAFLGFTSLECDPRVILAEIEISESHEEANAEIFDYTENHPEEPFSPLEHPDIFHRCMKTELICFENFAYELLINKYNGPARCQRMIDLECFSEVEFLEAIPKGFGSFISDGQNCVYELDTPEGMEMYVGDLGHSLLITVTNLLTYPSLRPRTIQRLRQAMPFCYNSKYVPEKDYQVLSKIVNKYHHL